MSFTYFDALTSVFGDRPFTTRELANRLGGNRSAKLLSELKHRGLVERVGRGKYRCLEPEKRPDLRTAEWKRVREVVLSGPDPKAWTGSSAVELWTGGGYRVSPSAYTRVFELAVPRTRVGEWRAYLAAKRVATDPRKRIGAKVELVPVNRLRAIRISGEPVVDGEEVRTLIRSHPGLYGNAEELLIDRS